MKIQFKGHEIRSIGEQDDEAKLQQLNHLKGFCLGGNQSSHRLSV